MRVLLAHPTRQHSHRFARVLEEEACLDSYCTLLPDRRSFAAVPGFCDPLLPEAVYRNPLEFLPAEKVRVLLGPLILQKMSSRLLPGSLRLIAELLTWTMFDRWVARQVRKRRPSVVIGYEMCCTRTFQVARELGIRCVLDAASFHYQYQDRVLGLDSALAMTWAGKRLRAIKEKEIELADSVICVSEAAKTSYLEAGVPAANLSVNPLGCDTQLFTPADVDDRTGGAKFIFVGTPVFHKGFDLLLACYDRLSLEHPAVQLHVAGDAAVAGRATGGRDLVLHGKLSHAQLAKLLAGMDCLVLPSRLESFGMVVVEALAVGVPVIVSDHAGASALVQDNINGWVVASDDEEQLFQKMLECCDNVEQLRLMQANCVHSVAAYDWSNYYERTRAIVTAFADNTAGK